MGILSIHTSQQQPWHLQAVETIIAELNSSGELGLCQKMAAAKRERDGANIIPELPPRPGWKIFLDYLISLPVALLTVAALLSLLTAGKADALIIMGVVVINAILGYITESQSERIINSLHQFTPPTAWVIREGKEREIDPEDIVRGDILILQPGSYVPADARLIAADHLSLDESALTGESIPVNKTESTLSQSSIPLSERRNMVYRGTFVTGGQGRAVVVATGQSTEMGQIQTLVRGVSHPPTPLEEQLVQAGGQLVGLSMAVCGLVLVLGLLRGYGTLEMLKTSMALAVAAVPEGLPTIATTTLALGLLQMRRHHVLIRRLGAVEALGAVQTICLDKTGTLTANRMSVTQIALKKQTLKFSGGNLDWGEQLVNPQGRDDLEKLMRLGVLCNESQIASESDETYTLKGSATEKALMEMAIALGIDVLELRQQHPRLAIHHRWAQQNFMVTVHGEQYRSVKENYSPGRAGGLGEQGEQKSGLLLAVKGNPDEVLQRCSTQVENGQTIGLTNEEREAWGQKNQELASQGLRVLGIAYRYSQETPEQLAFHDLIWVGLIALQDPLRAGAKEAIAHFQRAGIETLMITGDQRATAYAIGRELHLSGEKPLKILDSTQLGEPEAQSQTQPDGAVQIFARISPAHKLQIVQALQQRGEVVAMTGDGINDAPALKAADVGIALGKSGTDVAREVADVVLEDDRLETMILAIAQGRTIYNNIRKAVHFLLSTNLSEILVMLLANTLGLGQPLNAMQLLWLNLVTDIFPGLALAREAPEPDVLVVPPRSPREPILPARDLGRVTLEATLLAVSSLSAYGYGIFLYGLGLHASAIAFMSLVAAQLFHALACRSPRRFAWGQLPPNPYLLAALGGSLSLQLLALALPSLGHFLQVTPLNWADALVIAVSALLPLIINEALKG